MGCGIYIVRFCSVLLPSLVLSTLNLIFDSNCIFCLDKTPCLLPLPSSDFWSLTLSSYLEIILVYVQGFDLITLENTLKIHDLVVWAILPHGWVSYQNWINDVSHIVQDTGDGEYGLSFWRIMTLFFPEKSEKNRNYVIGKFIFTA